MKTTEIRWHATFADAPHDLIVSDQVTALPGTFAAADGNGRTVASEVAEQHFGGGFWRERFGDSDAARIVLTISAPAAALGTYDVTLRRRVRASIVVP